MVLMSEVNIIQELNAARLTDYGISIQQTHVVIQWKYHHYILSYIFPKMMLIDICLFGTLDMLIKTDFKSFINLEYTL